MFSNKFLYLDVLGLFDRIKKEQSGKLDVLVNNAYAGVNHIFTNTGIQFMDGLIDLRAFKERELNSNQKPISGMEIQGTKSGGILVRFIQKLLRIPG